jgi:hypothetical protein
MGSFEKGVGERVEVLLALGEREAVGRLEEGFDLPKQWEAGVDDFEVAFDEVAAVSNQTAQVA